MEEVEEGAFLKLLENHPKGLWAFFPALEDEKVAEALRRRAMKGRPLVLLFPEAEVHNPVSYSNTFFLGQLVWRNVRVKHLSLKTTGEEPIYILEGWGSSWGGGRCRRRRREPTSPGGNRPGGEEKLRPPPLRQGHLPGAKAGEGAPGLTPTMGL